VRPPFLLFSTRSLPCNRFSSVVPLFSCARQTTSARPFVSCTHAASARRVPIAPTWPGTTHQGAGISRFVICAAPTGADAVRWGCPTDHGHVRIRSGVITGLDHRVPCPLFLLPIRYDAWQRTALPYHPGADSRPPRGYGLGPWGSFGRPRTGFVTSTPELKTPVFDRYSSVSVPGIGLTTAVGGSGRVTGPLPELRLWPKFRLRYVHRGPELLSTSTVPYICYKDRRSASLAVLPSLTRPFSR